MPRATHRQPIVATNHPHMHMIGPPKVRPWFRPAVERLKKTIRFYAYDSKGAIN